MGRRVEYFCDSCKKLFGDNNHLNLKNGDLRLSHMNYSKEWVQSKINIKCQEYHFCDIRCLVEFLEQKIAEVESRVNPV